VSFATTDDGRAAYVAWTNAVQQYGGVVTSFPGGAPAARYPFAVIYPNDGADLNPIFHAPPLSWTADSAYGYFAAPPEVAAFVAAGGLTGVATVPGEQPPPMPSWYDSLQTTLKLGAWVLSGVVLLSALSYLPRGRSE
jgi:hypothetical protein